MTATSTPSRSVRRGVAARRSRVGPNAASVRALAHRLEARAYLAGVLGVGNDSDAFARAAVTGPAADGGLAAAVAMEAGPEFRVNTYTPNLQQHASVAMDADGDFVVAWQSAGQDDPPSASEGVYAQRYNAAGVAQGGEILVNTTIRANQSYPKVAMDADGDFVVVWEGPDAGDTGVYGRRFNAAGVAQGAEFPVNTTTYHQQINPAVAIDADGDFVVTWESHHDALTSIVDVYARRYSKTGAPVGGEFRVNTITTSNQWFPTVAMEAGGDFVIAWESFLQDPDDSTGIYAQRYDAAGGTAGGEFPVNNVTVGDQNMPSAAMDADGDFVITWHGREDGGLTAVYARSFNSAGGSNGLQFKVSTTIDGFQRYAAIAMDADGDFVVSWQNEYGDANYGETDVDAQRFAAGGARVDGEFQVNATTLGNHRYPAAAMDADGDFVIAWAGFGQDPGDNQFQSGVYARRYAENRPGGAARVTGMYARGQAWPASFLAYIAAQGLGSSAYGFALGGVDQLADLPWTNVDQLTITFDGAVEGGLDIRGVNVPSYYDDYSLTYDPATRTAIATFAQPLGADKILFEIVPSTPAGLDGEWTTGGSFPSGNGVAGGDFNFHFEVLPGNVNRTGPVLADDYAAVKARFFRSTATPGVGANAYTIFHDVDGNGSILANDYSEVKKRFFSSLPAGQVAVAASAAFGDRRIDEPSALRPADDLLI